MFATTGKASGWRRYSDEKKAFASIAEAHAYLRETYGKARRRKMYRDTTGGGAQQTGYMISFRPRWRTKGDPIAEQHWVEFRESKLLSLGE
jgi:hypothetical protein